MFPKYRINIKHFFRKKEVINKCFDFIQELIKIITGVTCWNPAFDVTPARLITGIITEKGVFRPSELSTLQSQLQDHKNTLSQL